MKRKRPLVERTLRIHIRAIVEAGVVPGDESAMLRVSGHTERVCVSWLAAGFGGLRAYFVCPGCEAGAMVLYAAPFLACRKCHGLAYRSENLTPLWRKREKLRKLQSRRGTDVLQKPKWTRWHTFLNLRRKIEAADHDFAAAYVRSRHGSALLR
jgi:hypothetical protein